MPPNLPRLVIEVFQNEWYGGRRGIVIEDTTDTAAIGFRRNISSVRIYKGPGYAAGANHKALFFQDVGYKGRALSLGPGHYQTLHDVSYNFGDVVRSIAIRAESAVDGPVWGTAPAVVDLYDGPWYRGVRTTIVRDEADMARRVTNLARSVRVHKGPDCPPIGCRVQLFAQPLFEGEPFSIDVTPQESIVEIPDVGALPQEMPQTLGSVKIEGWTSSTEFSQVVFQDEFDGTRLREGWEWTDPREGAEWRERQGWLLLRVQPGQDLWRDSNYDAPRLLRPATEDFSVETRLQITDETDPHGGLLVWFRENAFIRLEKTSAQHAFRGDIRFEQHTARGGEPLVGRGIGLAEARQLYLRIERRGNLFSGYASDNGVDWVSCGTAFASMGDPTRVGVHALCPGNMPPTATRFDYFKILKRPEESPLMDSRAPSSYRSPHRARRVNMLRKLT
ncbi:hypothetical protein CMK11_17030 [Candidatus Poribacteria bacterium]|nr:hypothetical protein [Candidatus Poribacteria bacterium]